MYFLIKKIKHALYRLFIMPFVIKTALKSHGKKVYIGERFRTNAKHVSLGNNTSIGTDANILCTNANVVIGNYVIIAHGLTIITGRHRYNIPGRYIRDITDLEKEPIDDLSITIEDDVWIAANVTILRGVTVGRGSIIGCGSIVTKDVEPYSIVAGNPAVKIGNRFSNEEKRRHEEFLSSNKKKTK